MCGIVGLQVRDPALEPLLGGLLATMLTGVRERGLDSAGIAVYGERMHVHKGVGDPLDVAAQMDLRSMAGHQGIAHTRMATESAVTAAHCHPFVVGDDLCLVHNGSFANHATIRRRLMADGIAFETDNDSEVAARYIGARLAAGDDLEKSLRMVCQEFDGFYTLLVTTSTEFAVVRDAIASKPAILAETDGWVAMASEYRALTRLPGIADARVFEPMPEEVHLWTR